MMNKRSSAVKVLYQVVTVSTLALVAGCSDANRGGQSSDPPPATGGSAGATTASAMGGSSALPGNTGGSAAGAGVTGGTGGSAGTGGSGGSGGSTGIGNSVGGGGAKAGSGGAPAGNAGNAGGGSGGGTAGTGPITPPVRDTASKQPVSNAPGYTVEGNYAYGPLTAQRLDVIYPPNAGPKGTQFLPAVLMFHGGAWIHGWKEANGKDHMSTFFNRFLAHGFMVCNAEYRVNDNTADGAVAPAAVQDALLAAKWCWDHLDYFHGDKTRYVVTGASAGGHLADMVGLTTPAAMLGPTSPTDFTIAAVVSGYGPADIEAEINAVAKGWIPTNLPNRAAVAKLVNPITYARMGVPPLIDVHGANDGTAPVVDSQRLINLLKAAGADATLHLVPNAGHGFTDATWPDAEKAMFDFLTARGIGK
jgi:acetyl esterase/lipase